MNLTDTIHTYLTTAPTSRFVQQTVEMVDAWEGHDNLLWRVKCGQQDAVLKLYMDAGQARSRRQFDGQQHFAPQAIAPRPLWYDRHPHGLSRQVMVYEWIEGGEIGKSGDWAIAELAGVMGRVHGGDAGEVQRFCPHPLNLEIFWRVERSALATIGEWLLLRKAQKLHALFQQIATACEKLATGSLYYWQQSPPTTVHGDLRLENVVVTPYRSLVLVDWEMFGLGDPSLEIATFLGRNQVDADSWLESYLAQVEQPFLSERIAVYRRLLPFQSLCYLINGLKAIRPEELTPEIIQALPFLFDTLEATLKQVATLFGIEYTIERSEIEKLSHQGIG